MENNKAVVFPAVRFIPDVNDKGAFVLDRNGEFKEGTLQVTLFKTGKNGSSDTIATHSEHMSYLKFKATREDIDHLDVKGLREYFPDLAESTEVEPPVEEPEDVEALKARIKELENAQKTEPDSEKTSGQTDASKPGAKDSAKKASSADKAKSEK